MPRKTTRPRESATISASETFPMRSRTLDRGIVVTLSSMMPLRAPRPLLSLGSSGTHNSGISVGSLVNGQTVIEDVA